MNTYQKGFANTVLTIAIVAILAGGLGYFLLTQKQSTTTTSTIVEIPATQQSSTNPTTVTFNVYFGKENDSSNVANCSYAIARTIPYTSAIGQASLVELFKGPTTGEKQQGYFSCFFRTDIVVRSLKIENGVATVNVSKEYSEGCGGAATCTAQSQSAVTNTLKQFPTVKEVKIQIEGIPQVVGQDA